MNKYDLGDDVRITGTFTDANQTLQDPTDVYCKYSDPDDIVTTLHYGVDPALARDSIGVYYVILDANKAGIWNYRFYSTGSGKAAGESVFKVVESAF